ncbi:hypothetical protein C8Q74DRAFT_348994 [Fomes fomentarius]|nr:hypothetical protein C8Q74DRAFT_348994 [Fomes fomentarius]
MIMIPQTSLAHHARRPSPPLNRLEDIQDAVSTAPTASHGHQEHDRILIRNQELGHSHTERCVVGTSRWDSRLPNDIWANILPQLHSGDLACLALVCKEIVVIVEAVLYKRVVLLSPHRLVQSSETIQHRANKDYVRSVAICRSQHGRIGRVTDTAFGEIMKYLHLASIEHLEIFHESTTGTCESEITLPPRVRSLDTSAAFLHRIACPLPPLRNLSIRLRESDFLNVHRLIGPLDGTLVSLRLRLERTSPFVQKRDNPVRLCARLGTRYLKYLEILEQRISPVRHCGLTPDICRSTHLFVTT